MTRAGWFFFFPNYRVYYTFLYELQGKQVYIWLHIIHTHKKSNSTELYKVKGFSGGTVVKNMPPSEGDARDMGSVSGSGGGNGNPFQYSCLENPMDRGAWRATVHGVAKSLTQLKWLSTHTAMERDSGEIFDDHVTGATRNPAISRRGTWHHPFTH